MPELHLEPLVRAKTYELVVRRIKEEIFAGRLKPGDRLPGERELSQQLQVSRPSVREAVRILQAMEVVRSRPGAGAGSGMTIATRDKIFHPEVGLWPEVHGSIGGALRLEDEHFISCVRSGMPSPIASLDDALHGLEIAEAIVQSAESGAEVAL